MTKRKEAKSGRPEIKYEKPIELNGNYGRIIQDMDAYVMNMRVEGDHILYFMDANETQVLRFDERRKTVELSDKTDKIFRDEIRDLLKLGRADEDINETEDDLSVLEEY